MALTAINPTYASLQITQKPSWVRPPSSYPHGSASSLSVTFEDPDGSKMKALLTERYLYAFGNRATVKKWKYRLNKTKDNSNANADKHDQASDSNDDEEDVEIAITTPAQQSSLSSFNTLAASTHYKPFTTPIPPPPSKTNEATTAAATASPYPTTPTPIPPRRTRSTGQARAK
jgi:hypothetical protein